MSTVLIIGYVWLEPGSSAAGSRMVQLIEFFLSEGYEVTFATTATKTPFMANLQDLGARIQKIRLNHGSFDEFLEKLQPEIVLFDRFMMEEQFAWRVSKICPNAIKILDTEDLHFLRKARQDAFREGTPMKSHHLKSDLAKREIASIYRCDLSLIISEVEVELLRKEFNIPEKLLFYLPFFFESFSQERQQKLPSFQERRHFISIGNFRHQPNIDMVIELKKEIWPMVKKRLPHAEIHIYGAYPTEKIQQLHDKKLGFLIKGRAENALEVLKKAKILLAPIRFGAGIKGKFLDAMQAGTPSLTTGIGAEGIHSGLPWSGIIEDDPRLFANAAIRLFSEEKEWRQSQENGFNILHQRFHKDGFQPKFRAGINDLQKHLKAHREQNFIGAMLAHHQLNSTKYLSKYIGAKNKLEELQKPTK